MVATAIEGYPWYETVEGDSLAQGDLLRGYEISVPCGIPTNEEIIPLENKTFDVVVMTQSCDIEEGKVPSILLCPYWDLLGFVQEGRDKGQNWGTKQLDALRQGNLPGYHLLNDASQDGLRIGLIIVDFHEVYTAPTASAREFVKTVGKRLRLLPPYREHLAQAFARFFMRVGLPAPIPREKIKLNLAKGETTR